VPIVLGDDSPDDVLENRARSSAGTGVRLPGARCGDQQSVVAARTVADAAVNFTARRRYDYHPAVRANNCPCVVAASAARSGREIGRM